MISARAVGVLLIACPPLQAQVLRIEARDSATNAPLAYVLLDIRHESGELALSTMTSDDGTRTVRLPRAGDYRIQLRRVGFRMQLMGPVHVANGETLPLVFRVPRVPAALPTVRVSEKDQCDITGRTDDDAKRVVALWEQMQTAFKLNELAQTETLPSGRPMSVTGYLSHTSVGDRTAYWHTVQTAGSGQSLAFGSFTSDDISKNGYVRYDKNRAVYIAPIELVLVLNAFVTDHCFRLVAGAKGNAGLVGLAFKPTRARRVPEIAGTLWADQQTGTPRYVEFRFLDDKIPVRARGQGKTGGEVYFGQLPNDTWATIGWRLRMPTPLGFAFHGETVILTEAAAIVNPTAEDSGSKTHVPVTVAYASFSEQFLPGIINAQIIDGETQQPLKHATVRLRQYVDTSATAFGTDETIIGALGSTIFASMDTTVISNESGRIMVGGLPPGVYDVRFSPAKGERSPVQPAAIDIIVKPHSVNSARLVTPVPQPQLARCGKERLANSIYGVVRLGDGPVPPFATTTSASITASWTPADGKKQERRTRADNQGRYLLCDLPKGVPVALRAVAEDPGSARVTADERTPRVEMNMVLGEWQMAFVPIQISFRSERN